MTNFKLIVTGKCNWTCDYCFRKEDNPVSEISNSAQINNRIVKYAELIKSLTDNILITGGEPGLMKPLMLEFLFNSFKDMKVFRFATNGAWFKTPSFNKYKHLDNLHVLYHCVQDLNCDIEYESVDLKSVKHTFVIVEDNLNDVQGFLLRYPNITFYPLFDLRKRTEPAKKFYSDVYDALLPFDNIPDQIKESARVMSGNDTDWVEGCIKKKPLRYRIDFVKNEITTCCVPQVGIEINEDNLIKIANKEIDLPLDERVCNFCVVRWLNRSKTGDISDPIPVD